MRGRMQVMRDRGVRARDAVAQEGNVHCYVAVDFVPMLGAMRFRQKRGCT